MKVKVTMLLPLSVVVLAAFAAGAVTMPPESLYDGKTPVVVETKAFKLTINPDATAKSLIAKATGEECLLTDEKVPVFASTQIRPFNNEIRLVQQAKRTTYPANRIRREGDLLYMGFETAPYQVAVRVTESPEGYAAFRIDRLISNTEDEHQYWHWNLDVPPVDSFRLLQLPVKNRRNFGEWLNVMWDEKAVVGVIGGTPYMDVDNEKRHGFRKLTVESLKSYGVANGVAVLAVETTKEKFLDQIDAVERDLGLPRGVQSRRDSRLNASLFWVYGDFRPENVDTIIRYMKQGGFRMLLIYYTSLVKAKDYRQLPDYTLDNGWTEERLTAAFDRLHKEGISIGFHTLQTFIGLESPYVTPETDHRLALLKHYTLARPIPLAAAPTEIFVEENPVAAPMQEKIRVLRFGTELFTYTGYTTERPYKFTGVKRRHLGTYAKDHPCGEIGGVLGISEAGARSSYVDQDSSLQDEVAEKIARIYRCGLDFLYFDGSEDANAPCTVNISLSQYRCTEACRNLTGRAPLFTEGCAKSHFGWHIQSGANAFDVFGPEIFKEKIIEYPYAAAQRLAQDFTRVDFGWWGFHLPKLDGEPAKREGLFRPGRRTVGAQVDLWEYGTSKAAAFDCPSTMQMGLGGLAQHRRTGDILETMRRWEDVRRRKWLTPVQKEMLKDPAREFHLLSDGKGGYELVEWRQLDVAGGKWTPVRAFVYEKAGRRHVVYWHIADKARLVLPGGLPTLEAENMKTWETDLSEPEIVRAFAAAKIESLTDALPSASATAPGNPLVETPARHRSQVIMGRDCWRSMTKYYEYGWPGHEFSADNPEVNNHPAIADVIPTYVAFGPPPDEKTGFTTWPKLEQNFTGGDNPALEIVTSNPDPSRPFKIANWSERRGTMSWGSPVTLDRESYRAWCEKHPNRLYDGRLGEWCNDLDLAFSKVDGAKGVSYFSDAANESEKRKAAFVKFFGPRPTNRYEQVAMLKRYFKMRQERNYGGSLAVLDAHINSFHIAGDCGAVLLSMETTRSGQYRYQPTSMFCRGAARQFGVPWEWFVAGYVNGWSTNGFFVGDCMCRYPTKDNPDRGFTYGKEHKASCWPGGSIRVGCGGPDGGISRSLFRRTNFLAYLAGANVISLEEWRDVLKTWDKAQGKTVFSPRGKIYCDFVDFITRHPDRGSHYSPVAVCVPLAQGYPTWGGHPFVKGKFGYTDGDKAVDAVFYTLVPGVDYGKLDREGVEVCLRNSRWADMYDVIAPDAESQSEAELLAVMKSYKALVVVGDYRDRGWEKALAQFESEGGQVVRVTSDMIADRTGAGEISRGGVRFPALEAELKKLQDTYFPFAVEGDCAYGLTATDDHVWLYVFNNAGVVKYPDAPDRLDVSKATDVAVSLRPGRKSLRKVTELLSGKDVAVAGGASFGCRLGPGDLAIFEIE